MTTVVHCRKEPFDVLIDRNTIWGNPYSHLPPNRAPGTIRVITRTEAIQRHATWIRTQPQLLARLGELRGKRLGCWCKPLPCHGDMLAQLADENELW